MFNLITTCHINKLPSGRYSYVGLVPHSLCDIVPADRSAIMGQRWFMKNGQAMEAKTKVFDTAQQAIDFATEQGVEIARSN